MNIHPKVKQALEETGLPWELESGGRHYKVRVAGRLAGIISKGSKYKEGSPRDVLNLVSQIRRAAAAAQGGVR